MTGHNASVGQICRVAEVLKLTDVTGSSHLLDTSICINWSQVVVWMLLLQMTRIADLWVTPFRTSYSRITFTDEPRSRLLSTSFQTISLAVFSGTRYG